MARFWPVAFVALVGCEQLNALGWLDGTRLSGRGATMFGAAETAGFQGWFDKQLSTACSFRRSEGGLICVPLAVVVEYSDADCETPLATVDPCAPDKPGYVTNSERNSVVQATCEYKPFETSPNQTLRVFKVLDEEVVGATFTRTGGGCVARASSPEGTKRYRVGAEVGLEGLVRGKLVNEAQAGGLHRYVIDATDGSRQEVSWANASGHELSFVRLTDSEEDAYAVPTGVAYVSVDTFAEGSCQQPAASYYGASLASSELCPPLGVLANIPPASACGQSSQALHAVGAAIPSPFGRDGDVCSPDAIVYPGERYFEVGDVVSPGSLVKVTRQLRGTGRARRYVWLDDAGHTVRRDSFYDYRYSSVCDATRFSDGKTRCLPSNSVQQAYFADPDCSQPIAGQYAGDANCPSPKPTVWFKYAPEAVGGTCGFEYKVDEVRDVKEPYAGSIFSNAEGPCVEVTQSTQQFFSTGTPLAFGDLVEIISE